MSGHGSGADRHRPAVSRRMLGNPGHVLRRVDSSKAGGVHGLDHEHEDIRVFTVPFTQAMDELAAGKYLNAPIVMSLQWLALNRDKLRRKWL